jgi:xanthine dehydrogenase accessory factor
LSNVTIIWLCVYVYDIEPQRLYGFRSLAGVKSRLGECALSQIKVLVRGAGEQASGIAHRLHRCHFRVCMTEAAEPMAIRRGVSFSEAVRLGSMEVEGVVAIRVPDVHELERVWEQGKIPVIVDPAARIRTTLRPQVVVDAILAKANLGTSIDDAPIVIGVGPGFEAGIDVHAVVETNRGHNLGRVFLRGHAAPDTGVPAAVDGYALQRVLKTPVKGIFRGFKEIGDPVSPGDVVGEVDEVPMKAEISGVIRGILPSGLCTPSGMKAGDIDPRMKREYCFQISDKARAIAGGVLEAILIHDGRMKEEP